MQRFVNPTPFRCNAGIEYLFMAVMAALASCGARCSDRRRSSRVESVAARLAAAIGRGQAGNYETIVFGV